MKELQNAWNLSATMDFNITDIKQQIRMLTDLLSFSNINKYTMETRTHQYCIDGSEMETRRKRMCLNGENCRETHQVKKSKTYNMLIDYFLS